ncbi:unnamed protein product [Darwinula stevensoni]|uniref:Sulfotransferase n=1 Tax=Darwinula stevensoni TaxID=69355 RepID=A0A7R8X8K1_9CRUS|nr:unnamed protein product [Darwinula stevensoni]CAG0888030.1 unnamed protein product [Darwinula stevensoni]
MQGVDQRRNRRDEGGLRFMDWFNGVHEQEREKPFKILLFAYPRSGSSLIGDLLSAANRSRYYFEPLYFIDDLDPSTYNFSKRAEEILDSLFRCDLRKVDAAAGKTKRYKAWKKGKGYGDPPCVSSQLDYIVQKVIRLPATHHVIDWLERNPDILVIHLVRDTRGIANSISNQPKSHAFDGDLWKICDQMWVDVLAVDSLPRHRWRRVRYEDAVRDPFSAMEELYDFMNIPYTEEVQGRIGAHFGRGLEEARSNYVKYYYSTYRNASEIDPERWRGQLDAGRISSIEEMCGRVLDVLGYSRGNAIDL